MKLTKLEKFYLFSKNFLAWNTVSKHGFIDQKNLLKFKAKDQFYESIEQIYSNRSIQFFKQNAFLTCSWWFLRSNTYIRKIRIQIEKKRIEMYKPTGKVTKQMSLLKNSKPDLEPKSSGSDQVWFISGSQYSQQ